MRGASYFVYDNARRARACVVCALSKLVPTWMDGWYRGDEDNAIIDTDVFVDNAKKFGSYCGNDPTVSIVTAADEVPGK